MTHGADPGGAARLSRRTFLGCCSALALAGWGCAGLSPRMRSGYILATDPPDAQYQPILDGLILALVPCERADFPLTGSAIRSRLLKLFALEQDPRFLDLQKALILFDQINLFAEPVVPPWVELHALDAAARGLDTDATVAASLAADRQAYSAFANGAAPQRFINLPVARQRAYLDLWRPSGFLIRRQFYASAKALVLISAYSMDAMWPTLGYAGPLLDKGHA